MKTQYWSRIRISLITFAIGLAFVTYWGDRQERSTDEELASATVVTIARIPRFMETFRACGPGYVQGYETNDGFELTEGNSGCNDPEARFGNLYRSTKSESVYVFDRENDDRRFYKIYDLKTGHCVRAPSYELAVELQNYLKGASGENRKR